MGSVFILRTDCELPEELVSFLRLLLQSEDEWKKTAKKSKLPKPKVDKDVLDIAIDVLEARLKAYPTSIKVCQSNSAALSLLTSLQDDEKLLSPGSVEQLSLNKKNAVIVRLGEKRILQGTLTQLRSQVAALSASSRKRSRDDDKGGRGKKARK